jgi:hypothetical protein
VLGVAGFRFDKITALSSPGLMREDDPERPDVERFRQIVGEGQKWDRLASTVAVNGKYKYTGESIKDAPWTVEVGGFTPWATTFAYGSKIANWPVCTRLADVAQSETDPSLLEAASLEAMQMRVACCGISA